jgi:predicted nucleic acid-binding protein
VVVKWFKKGEEFEEEALRLRREVLSSRVTVWVSELVPLEVCRALVKGGYPSGKVREAYATLNEMGELGFLKAVSTAALRDEAEELIVELKLFVADALSLAAAVVNSSDLLTEDKHLLRTDVRETMERKGLKLLRLEEAYRGASG